MKALSLIFVVFLSGCTTFPKMEFKDQKGCFLLFNMKTQKLLTESGTTCREQFVASSTFKVPLSVMAFDSGVLKNTEDKYKWNGVKGKVDAWNQDHNARTWMQHSVVWYSKALTPKIGEEKIKKYLVDFKYGNQDISGGLQEAWLHSPSSQDASLRISPYEQLEFMKALWSNKLPVSPDAMSITREIMFLETSPNGFKLSGKTGSNRYKSENVQLGWFIAHLSREGEEYIAVVNFSDLKPVSVGGFGGPRAREMMTDYLKREKLW